MKCPYCNGKHPDEFEFCPKTGKRIELKACANDKCSEFGKKVLPPDAMFCPKCGCEINTHDEENNNDDCEQRFYYNDIDELCPKSDDYMMRELYQMEQEFAKMTYKERDKESDEELMSQFFPVCGITLGKTTRADLRNIEYKFDSINYNDKGDIDAYINGDGGFALFTCSKGEDCFTKISLYKFSDCYEMLDGWKEKGLSWSLSYDIWVGLLKELHFTIIERSLIENQSSVIWATSAGGRITFILVFSSYSLHQLYMTVKP